jgi:hypothetical protein
MNHMLRLTRPSGFPACGYCFLFSAVLRDFTLALNLIDPNPILMNRMDPASPHGLLRNSLTLVVEKPYVPKAKTQYSEFELLNLANPDQAPTSSIREQLRQVLRPEQQPLSP